MLSDTEVSCLAIALAVCLKEDEEKHRWMKECFKKKRNVYTLENLLKDLRLSEPSDFQSFLRLDATSFDDQDHENNSSSTLVAPQCTHRYSKKVILITGLCGLEGG